MIRRRRRRKLTCPNFDEKALISVTGISIFTTPNACLHPSQLRTQLRPSVRVRGLHTAVFPSGHMHTSCSMLLSCQLTRNSNITHCKWGFRCGLSNLYKYMFGAASLAGGTSRLMPPGPDRHFYRTHNFPSLLVCLFMRFLITTVHS